jgi:hypothetical protein
MPREFREYHEDKEPEYDGIEPHYLHQPDEKECQQPTFERQIDIAEHRFSETEKAELDSQVAEIIACMERAYPSHHQEQHDIRVSDPLSIDELKKDIATEQDATTANSSSLEMETRIIEASSQHPIVREPMPSLQKSSEYPEVEKFSNPECQDHITIDSPKELDELLGLHSHLQDFPGFREVYRQARLYVELKAAQEQGALLDVTPEDLEGSFDIPKEVLRNWLTGKYEPILIRSLRTREAQRQQESRSLTPCSTPRNSKPILETMAYKEQHPTLVDSSTHHITTDTPDVSESTETVPIRNKGQVVVKETTPIHNATTLNAELDRFPHIRTRWDYPILYLVVEKYFEVLKYQDNLARNETSITAISDAVDTSPLWVRQWLIENRPPRLLRLLDCERTNAVVLGKIQPLETQCDTSNNANLKSLKKLEMGKNHNIDDKREQVKSSSSLTDSTEATVGSRRITIRIWQPHICNNPIINKEQLHSIIDQEYHGIKRIKNFQYLIADAELHLELIEKLRGQKFIQHGDLTHIAKEFPRTRTWRAQVELIRVYIRNAGRPQLYRYIERAQSKTENQSRLSDLHRDNCGIRSTEDVKHRLDTFYATKDLIRQPRHQHRLSLVDKYFRALKLLENGGFFSNVAKEVGVHRTTVRQWLYNKDRPDLVQLARLIPEEDPGPNYKWLPTKLALGRGYEPIAFVRVPVIVREWDQYTALLKQRTEVSNWQMRLWKERFGEISKEQALAYILGMIVSDADKPLRSYASSRVQLRLTKAHQWSEQVGEATCYYLGKLGIHAERKEDIKVGDYEIYRWQSKSDPFLMWLIRSGIGLEFDNRTTYDAIRADYLLKASYEIRLRFLQGMNDGDGYAVVKGQYIGNACGVNSRFYQELIKTFGIESKIIKNPDGAHKDRIDVIKQESIKHAAELPFFLHAIGRQENLEKILKMFEVRSEQMRGLFPDEVAERIMELREQGESFGGIAEIIFNEYGLSYSISSINNKVKKWINAGKDHS